MPDPDDVEEFDPRSGPWIAVLAVPLAGGAALGLTGLPVIVGWTSAAGAASLQSVRAVGIAWLAALNIPVRLDDVPLSLLPVGWSVITILLLIACGRWLASKVQPHHAGEVVATAAWGAVPLAAGAAAVAFAVSDTSVVISVTRAGLQVFLIALAVLALSMARASRTRLSELVALPARATVRSLAAGGTAAAVLLFAAAAALTTAALIVNIEAVTRSMTTMTSDPSAAPLILVLSLGYLPAVCGWSLATLLGLGQVVPLGIDGVPALPVVVGQSLPVPPVAVGISGALIGLIAGLVAGRIALRQAPLTPRWTERLLLAVGMGIVAAMWVGIVLSSSGGSLGTDALALVGPSPWLAAATAAWLVAIGAILGMIRLPSRDDDEQDRMHP